MSKANLANAILAAPINTSDTSATLVTGYGATMPPVPFKLTFTPFGQLSTRGNSEIVLVTGRSGEVLTIERAKNGTSAKSFETGDVVSNGIYIENSTAVGDIFMSMRITPEDGRLFMDGGTYNKADYPLFWAMASGNPAYIASSNTSTFTLTDMRGRVPVGKAASGTFGTLADTMGAETHTLTTNEMPVHSHGYLLNLIHTDGRVVTAEYVAANIAYGTARRRYSDGTNDAGGGAAHNNIQPSIVVNYEVVAS